ncbi:MAG: hypothetical protein R3178_06230, partial [Rhodothermales bacterium]|nr:hypothetical protein [Rhodothermales bacterium]
MTWPWVMMLGLILGACDRPFVDVSEPEIEILAPDTDEVAVAPQTTVRVRASSFRPIDRVELNAERMDFDVNTRLWSSTVDLSPGVNNLVIAAYDIEQVAGRDTLVLLYISASFNLSPASLPNGLGNHATVLMGNGDILVTGGSRTPDGEAIGGAATLTPG